MWALIGRSMQRGVHSAAWLLLAGLGGKIQNRACRLQNLDTALCCYISFSAFTHWPPLAAAHRYS
jgi:hypothetical protein